MTPPARLLSLVIGFGLLALAGCGDEEPQKHEANGETPASATSAIQIEKWLQPGSKLTAAQWIASRGGTDVKPLHDADVKRIAADLAAANALYRESERMIANRAVQLEGMLKDIGVIEPAAEILSDLTHVAGEIGQTEGFGAVSQHYFNLRSNEIARGAALATLSARYGPRQ